MCYVLAGLSLLVLFVYDSFKNSNHLEVYRSIRSALCIIMRHIHVM